MKKISLIFAAFLCSANSANATGFYVGADLVSAEASHQAKNTSSASGPQNSSGQNASSNNVGANVGVRFDFLNLLASGELFYDNLQTSTRNFAQNSGAVGEGDDLEIRDRYGVKGNLGFAVLPRVTTFITYGVAKVNYSSNVPSAGQTISKNELTPLYGVGVLVDSIAGVSLKLSYDYQKFDMRYASGASKIKTSLGVAKIGAVYNF